MKTRKPGRPKVSPERKRDASAAVMYTASEKKKMRDEAAKLGLGLSDLIRRRSLQPWNYTTEQQLAVWVRPRPQLTT